MILNNVFRNYAKLRFLVESFWATRKWQGEGVEKVGFQRAWDYYFYDHKAYEEGS